MSAPIPSHNSHSSDGRNLPLAIGLLATLIFFIGSGILSYRNARFLNDDAAQVAHTHEVITSLDDLVSLMKDAETGQRGFLITGEEKYLEPFTLARAQIDDQLGRTQNLTKDNPMQQALLIPIKSRIDAKFAELDETINLRRAAGFDAARAVVITDRGKNEMDALRSKIREMDQVESELRTQRVGEMQKAYRISVISGILTAFFGIVLSIVVAYLIKRTLETRRRQDWLKSGNLGLASAMFGEQRIEKLGENILSFLAKYLDAHAGALFIGYGSNFKRVATYGVPAGSNTPERFDVSNGLLGQAVREKATILLNDVPDGYLMLGSGLGQGKPRHLAITTATMDDAVNAVIELGFIHPLNELTLELLKQSSESIGVAVKSALYRANLQELLEETQRQSEELQTQSEELRVSNEELEEQSRVLKESQSRLEQQQAELEQTNSQLEEQAQLLEVQRDDLSRAKASVQSKADELERTGRYKSDFLANMSHELRTPLNSSLILSKLLADNPEGNLTEEQVKYAHTIQTSGNDLLALINDILDLSKIEAGHMEVHAEAVTVTRLVSDLTRVFEPLAKQKNLAFKTTVAPNCPEIIETDRQRFEQILRNLLSNAFKFTDEGEVELSVSVSTQGLLAFEVSDTGIGISEENQSAIFDAFRQADGTISRKYGGTGLGLSISRELSRLLGGTIQLQSAIGKGSKFTLLLPKIYNGKSAHASIPASTSVMEEQSHSSNEKPAYIKDDREKLIASVRTILIVEDDESFARILYDMAHESGFQCLITSNAEDALTIARQYLPNAVLLDVGLPDNSGLSVLDRLKQDMRTRHIPVHVISAGDHSQTAMSLGAVGYMVKPVKNEDLIQVLKKIEGRFSGGMRRVLIVEDDAVQRESLTKLLGSSDVQAIAVGTVTKCLEKLKESTFDCMVLDLSLPDASGYALLETLSKEDSYSFPPVIVYTGRDLSNDEEQRLRRYSKSIIIKGAKSPERLLDEVTLFLHQVVSDLPPEQQKMLKKAQNRDAVLEGRRILIVEDDVRNIYSLTNILEPRGAQITIARNGREALDALEKNTTSDAEQIDMVLMDVMMPEMDGLTATREIRNRPEWKKLPIIMLTAKAMRNDQERCLEAGANDYMAKPLDVEKLLSLVQSLDAEVARINMPHKTEDIEIRLLLEAIFQKYHYDFRGYSLASVKRRLQQAKSRFGCNTISLLQDKILHNPAILNDLLGLMTVQVSELFRDPLYFKAIRERVIPHLRTYPSLKVWIAGCSNGEEFYSLAIMFREEGLEDKTIFYATDINPDALKKAQAGVYELDRIQLFTENHRKSGGKSSLSDYYTAAYGGAIFDKTLRERVVFSDHSLATDAVFAEVQFISCRNVLIYFDRELQDRATNLFKDSLIRKGFLGLGSKESLHFSVHADAFSDFLHEEKLYQRRGE